MNTTHSSLSNNLGDVRKQTSEESTVSCWKYITTLYTIVIGGVTAIS